MVVSLVPPIAIPYVGNHHVLEALAGSAARRYREKRSCHANIHGFRGSGVTSLSTELHRRHKDSLGLLLWLPGSQLDGKPTQVGELLGHLLRQLGVPDADHEVTEAGRANSCRRLLTKAVKCQPVMIVIDDYQEREQIEPFVALELPGLMIVVNTTERRVDLGERNFRYFEPQRLSSEEARELFVGILDDTAADISDGIIDRLVACCDGVPLQVRLLAASLIDQPELAEVWLGDIEASRERLLKLDEQQRIKQWLELTFSAMETWQRDACLQLAALPVRDFGFDLAMATMSMGSGRLRELLAELVKRHLLIRQKETDRYGVQPFVRACANSLASGKASDDMYERGRSLEKDVIRRAVAFYVDEALPRARTMSDRWWVDTATERLTTQFGSSLPTYPDGHPDAWFGVEFPNLVLVVQAAGRLGLLREAWLLCVGLWNHVHVHQHHDAWIASHLCGLKAARAAGDLDGVMQVASQLGAAYLAVGKTAEAKACFNESLGAARTLGHALGEQSALEWLGKLLAKKGRHREALKMYAMSRRVNDLVDDLDQQERASATLWLQEARSLYELGRLTHSAEVAEQASEIFDRRPNEIDNSAKCREVRGQALCDSGLPDVGLVVLIKMLALFEKTGSERSIARGRVVLASAYRSVGRDDEAVVLFRQALAYYERVGAQAADDVREALKELSAN